MQTRTRSHARPKWVYPWYSWYEPADLHAAAAASGLVVLHVADSVTDAMRTGMLQRGSSPDWHEWVVAATPGAVLPRGALARLVAWGAADLRRNKRV